MTQLQESKTQQSSSSGGGGGTSASIKGKTQTRRRANSVAFACRTDYGLPDSDDESPPKNPLLLFAEPERRRSAIDSAESAKERDRPKIFTLS